MVKTIRKLSLFSACFVLGACTVGPDYKPSDMSVLEKWFAGGSSEKAVSDKPVETRWWTIFKDPLLESFINEAVKNNNDIKVAVANIKRARALRQQDRAGFFPEVDATSQASRTKGSDNLSSTGNGSINNFFDAGFDASWELDIFGGTRRSVEASSARIDSAVANYNDVMLAVQSEVARNYYEARGYQKRVAITEENAELQRQTFDLIDARLKAGEASDFDYSRAQGEYQLTRARVPNLNAELKSSIFTLSVLLGKPPEALLEAMEKVQPLPTPPDVVPVGLRSDILRRRPDIQIAERDLAASVADIGVQTANLFPKFFITGNAGSEADVFGDLFDSGGGFWGIGSLMQWPIFRAGAIQAGIKVEEAESEAALATYHQTILEALADTESALSRYGEELETRRRLEQAVQSRRKSVYLARQLFDAGEQDYLGVLDAERELTSTEDSLVVSETQSITKLIALYAALGGGWEAFDEHQNPVTASDLLDAPSPIQSAPAPAQPAPPKK